MAEALYRKYRPQIFADVVGQEHIERTIKNAIEKDKVSHAYLFCGPRGTGKTTTARLLAKALLCEKGPTAEPDGTCEDCKLIAQGTHPDVYELDAASRTGVDNVREEIIGRVQFAPTRGRYKIYIIDEVHMLSVAAFNALLKTLEEPPSHVVFILATTDPQKVPETIHSRCQRFDFRRISPEAMVARLGAICVSEGVEFEGDALELIAHRAEGGLRNALTSLEQLIAFGEGKVTMEVAERMLGSLDSSELAAIVSAVGKRDVATCFRWTSEYVETGADLAQFASDFTEHIRNMYILATAGQDVVLEVSESTRRELEEELSLFGKERLARMLCVLGDVLAELRTSTNPRLSFEIGLVRMCRPDSDLTLEGLAERIEALEAGHSAVAHVVSVSASVSAAPDPAVPVSVQAVPAAVTPAQTPISAAAAPALAPVEPVSAPVTTPVPQPAPVAPVQSPSAPTQAVPAAKQASAPMPATPAPMSVTPAQQPSPAPSANTTLSASLQATLENPAALQRAWSAAIGILKKEKMPTGVLFMNTKAVFNAEKSLLVVEFPAENTFAFTAAQKPDIQEALDQALTRAFGEPVVFAYAKAGARTQAKVAPQAATQARSAAQATPRPQAASRPQTAPQPNQASQVQTAPRPASQPQAAAQPVPSPAPQAVSSTAPQAAQTPAPQTAPSPTSQLTSAPQPAPAPSPSSTEPPTSAEPDLETLLTTSFGDGVVLEEVNE